MIDGQGQTVSTADDDEKRGLDGEGHPIDGTRKNADGTVTLFLETPVTVMSQALSDLTIKRPRGKEMRGLDAEKGAVGAALKYLSTLANVPPSAVDQLDGADIKAAGDIIKGFMRKTRGSGGN